MKKYLFLILMASVILANFFYINNKVYAYDIPQIINEENIDNNSKNNISSNSENNKENNKNDSMVIDNNYVFIGCYKGLNYYLDVYSIKIKKNTPNKQSWSQFIFPIGSNVTAKNSKSQKQNFFFDGYNAYNSNHKNNLISEISDEEDRIFILNCFKTGYQYAFNNK